MDKALVFNQVSFRYKGARRPALKEISFSLNAGECLVITGSAASGKTTLCHCISGLIPQVQEGVFTGQVVTAGYDTTQTRVQALAKRAGLVMQDPETQILEPSVLEEVAFGPRNFLVPAEKISEKVADALTLVELEGFKLRETLTLSGGEKQRLAIAGALASGPDILVLDEPAAELDPVGRAHLYKTLARLQRLENLTLVIVEQHIHDLAAMVDKVMVLSEGQVKTCNRIKENILPEILGKPMWAPPKFMSEQSAQADAEPKKDEDLNRPALLEICHLNVARPPLKPILTDVSLRVHSGDFIALMGHNGAGKTTLAMHLNGLIQSPARTLFIRGKDIRDYDPGQVFKLVGLVFQNPDHQIFQTSVEKEVGAGLVHDGLSKADIAVRVDEILSLTGLEQVRQAHPFTLGRGHRQMVALASILVLCPKILVVDEPFTGLDEKSRKQVADILVRLSRSGTAVILITHDLELARIHAERLVVLKKGGIVMDTRTRAMSGKADLVAAGLLPGHWGTIPEPEKTEESVSEECTDERKTYGFGGLDIRSKCSLFFLFMGWTMMFNHPLCHMVMTSLIIAAGQGAGVKIHQLFSRLAPLAPLFVMVLIFTGFSTPNNLIHPGYAAPLVSLGKGVSITLGGVMLGLTFVLRLINMVGFSKLILETTPLDEFITLFSRLRFPRTLSFVITTAMGFVPKLDRKREQILRAQKSRGIDAGRGSRFSRFRASIAVMIPLFVNAILIADQLTMALMSRGFGYDNAWTRPKELALGPEDYCILGLCVAGLGIALWIRLNLSVARL